MEDGMSDHGLADAERLAEQERQEFTDWVKATAEKMLGDIAVVEPGFVVAYNMAPITGRCTACGQPVTVDSRFVYKLPFDEQQPKPPDSLDAAWTEAEAVIAERKTQGWGGGYPLTLTNAAPLEQGYRAEAELDSEPGPTPAAALRALAAKLRAKRKEAVNA
jgi:hypothetical protein